MGVALYYKGRLKSPKVLSEFLFVVKDIAHSMDWSYIEHDDPWDAPVDLRMDYGPEGLEFLGNAGLKGIIVKPHSRAESLWFLFNKTGHLHSLFSIANEAEGLPYYGASTNTQLAGVDLHIRLVKLLQYLGDKYFKDFTLSDDCGYVESGDRDEAQRIFGVINRAIEVLEEGFKDIKLPLKAKEDMDFILGQIEEKLKDSFGDITIKMYRGDEEE